MKPLLLLLALSLATNSALLIKRSRSSLATHTTASTSSSTATAVEKTSASSASNPSAGTALTSEQKRYAPLWEKLRAGDSSVVAGLRAAGWPEDAIRTLVITQVTEQFRARARALRPDLAKAEYWKQNPYGNLWTPESMKAFRDLGREQKALVKSLLGTDYVPPDYADNIARRYGGLPITPDQAEAIQMVEEDYRILSAEIRGPGGMIGNTLLSEDREKLAFLEKEKTADLAKILPPELLLDFELRNSPVASSLRNQLTAFSPTEEEFRQLFAIQKTADEAAGYTMGGSQAARLKSQSEADAQIKQILSPERYADYTRSKNYEYRQLYQLATRLQLPKENAAAAYDLKADYDKRLREIPRKPDPENKKAAAEARAALVAETEEQLIGLLGQRGYDAIKSSGATWISRLSPPASAKP